MPAIHTHSHSSDVKLWHIGLLSAFVLLFGALMGSLDQNHIISQEMDCAASVPLSKEVGYECSR